MNHCTNCGEPLTGSARFCAGCGAPADTDLTRLSSGPSRAPREREEETRVASSGPWVSREPQRVRPLQPTGPLARPLGGDVQDIEKVVFRIRPTLLFVKVGYAAAALAAVLLFGLLTYVGAPAFVAIPLALALLLVPAYRHLMRNTVTYTLTDSKIEIEQGLLSRTTRNIPLKNIQDVTVTSTLAQRVMRFGDVVVDNASDAAGATTLDNIPDPRRHADLILRELRRWR
ncbi:MAG TPA: PH domain-containing protein [Pyrinomonadaceae bacterium]|jgi:membrane protein YdbS with pleckstrin-like domain|nr:PH domain-containing protein [Pyrinomonadaceae bacterium]